MNKVIVLYNYKRKKQLIAKGEKISPTPNTNLIEITDEETKKAMEKIGRLVDRYYPE